MRHLQPWPARPHTAMASALAAQLLTAFQLAKGGPRGWWVLFEPEVHLARHVLVPDIAGWRKDEVPTLDRELAHFDERPAWVSEVLSPSTERVDRIEKLRIHHELGVAHAWLVDPEHHTLEVHSRSDAGYVLTHAFEGEESVAAPPFEALPLELGTLWLGTGPATPGSSSKREPPGGRSFDHLLAAFSSFFRTHAMASSSSRAPSM